MPIVAIPASPATVLVNFLDIVRRLVVECGAAKDPTVTVPTVSNPTGEVLRFVGWAASAWRDIQDLHPDWRFMRTPTSFLTVDGQALYTPAQCGIGTGRFSYWYKKSFRNYRTSVGTNSEIFMSPMNYDIWRDTYQYGALRNSKSQPFVVTIAPDSSLGLGPVPLADFTVIGDYQSAPIDLQADGDVPTLPNGHSKMIIVYKAMMSYGAFAGAAEVYARGEKEYKVLKRKLENDQLPAVSGGVTLA